MVIAKNVTVAQAYGVLGLVLTNQTGHVTAFARSAADEFYTLGRAQAVDDLVPNDVVENSGNFTAPPPSPTFWDQFWNAIAGLASAIWNAVVAVAQFFINVVKWLVDIAIGLYKGLVEGNWTYMQENVIEPFVAAIQAFLDFIFDFVDAFVRAILRPIQDLITNALAGWKGRIQTVMDEEYNSYLATGQIRPSFVGRFAVAAATGPIVFVAVLAIILSIIFLVVSVFLAVVSIILEIVALLVLNLLMGTAGGGYGGSLPSMVGPTGLTVSGSSALGYGGRTCGCRLESDGSVWPFAVAVITGWLAALAYLFVEEPGAKSIVLDFGSIVLLLIFPDRLAAWISLGLGVLGILLGLGCEGGVGKAFCMGAGAVAAILAGVELLRRP